MEIKNASDFGAIIPSFLDEYPLDPYEFRLYARIQRRAGRGECFESLPQMAKGCCMSLSKARAAFRVLNECGLIDVIDRASEGKPYLCSTTHQSQWVKPSEVKVIRRRISPSKSDRGTKSDTTPLSDLITEGYPIKESNKETLNESLPPTPQREKEEGIETPPQESQEPDNTSLASLENQQDLSQANNSTPEIQDSALSRYNNTFAGRGDVAPDGKLRIFGNGKGTWRSVASDPWMQSERNPLPEFKVWVAQGYEAKGDPRAKANAAGEIRNNYMRAADLWEAYQSELARQKEAEARVVQFAPAPPPKTVASPISATAKEQFRQRLLNKKVESCTPKSKI